MRNPCAHFPLTGVSLSFTRTPKEGCAIQVLLTQGSFVVFKACQRHQAQ